MVKRETVAALIVRDGRVLLCQRSADRAWHPGVWDLPGGHVVPGESAADALVREVREELGVRIAPGTAEVLENEEAVVSVFQVVEWEGQIGNAAAGEHSGVKWMSPADASAVSLGPLAGHLLRRGLSGEKAAARE